MAVPPDFDQLVQTFEREAFRLETLRQYRIEPEWSMFTASQSGEDVVDYPWPKWLETVSGITTSHRDITRLLAVKAPPSAFNEFRLRQYRHNVEAGEQVKVLFTDHIPVTGDFWLFDDRIAALLKFDDEGRPLGVDITDERALINDLVELKEDLLDWGEPAEGYWHRYLGSASTVSPSNAP
jgi:hypothetical protein